MTVSVRQPLVIPEPAAAPRVGDPKVVAWRYDQLVEAGYSLRRASVLAERADVDLHFARELLERGCSQGRAVRILL